MAETNHVKMEWSKVADYIIIGTDLCCTKHTEELYALGIKADIDLEFEQSHQPDDDVIVFLRLPTKDKTASSIDQLLVGTAVLRQLVQRKQLTYVHCQHGHGRAPTMVAAYFILDGLSVDEAVTKVAAGRKEIHIEPVQHERLVEFFQYIKRL